LTRGRVKRITAQFIRALQHCDATSGPLAGKHSWYRGASPAHYDEQTRHCLATLAGHIDTARAAVVWGAALTAEWRGMPVWFHGDIAHFGCAGVGDPACDLAIAWTAFAGDSREAFREAVDQDGGTWAQARGWALWKALINLTQNKATDQQWATINQRVLHDVLADHEHG
jgi:aminoglycoside phosphotransferase (APT) family kinase protein